MVVWLLVVFLQLLFLGQLYQAETEDGGFDVVRLAPVPRGAIAVAKTAASALLAGGAELLALGLLARVVGSGAPLAPGLLALIAIETVGMAAVGSLLFAAAAAGEEPALDLYALVLILVAPMVAVSQEATGRLFAGASPADLRTSHLLLGVYAVALAVVAAVAYGGFAQRAPAPVRRPSPPPPGTPPRPGSP